MATVYTGSAPHYREAAKLWKKEMKERAEKMLFDAQLIYFQRYQEHESRYATLRDRLLTAFETGKQAAMEKSGADEKVVQAQYERDVDEAWASYEKKREVAYAIYRSRIERATKKHKEMLDALVVF